MSWEIRMDPGRKQMWLEGELTIFSALDIRDRLQEALAELDELSIDLSRVDEIDTAGVQLMLLAKRKEGKTVRFTNHSDEVLRLLDLANLGQSLGDPLLIKAQ